MQWNVAFDRFEQKDSLPNGQHVKLSNNSDLFPTLIDAVANKLKTC